MRSNLVFQVEKSGHVIAGPDAAGWTAKVKLEVNRAGQHFSGPLDSPYELWHYSYTSAVTLPPP
jgi:S-formylglutathione hydrolase FrmB